MALITDNTSILETGSSKGQDFVAQGKRQNGDLWYLVIDGHGKNKVIDALRNLDYLNIMEMEEPATIISKKVKELGNTFRSGATLSIVIITPTKMDCYWCGDSTIKIWKDNVEIFASKDHNYTNPDEVRRMNELGHKSVDDWAISVIDDKTLTMIRAPYYLIETVVNDCGQTLHDTLNMTSALGHNGKTGDMISHAEVRLEEGASYDMVAATDGLWDMVHPGDNINMYRDAIDITDFAKMRWMQEWCYRFPENPDQMTTMDDQMDDIGVAVWKGRVYHLD
jgi:serine/threonine protein phosphatase PrpC|tara:strand:- start:26 stop:865 length:840 start_codon:yes stop_codon:yes gene_type:complete